MAYETVSWFLGAQTGAGFCSLYSSFFGEGDFVRIIKGGSSRGRDAFLRRIARRAEEAGCAAVRLLSPCEPGALDGVYLPGPGLAWVDGNPPHVLEPDCFGASGAHLDLGAYLDLSALEPRRRELSELSFRERDMLSRARSALSAAELTRSRSFPAIVGRRELSAAARRALSVAEKELPRRRHAEGRGEVSLLFISSFTHEGEVFLGDTLTSLCPRIYLLDDRYGLATPFIGAFVQECAERGVDCLLCPSPTEPRRAQALLLPSLSLGFLAAAPGEAAPLEYSRHLRLDALIDGEKLRAARSALRSDAKLAAALLAAAQASFASAHELHELREGIYAPHTDLSALLSRADREFAAI